MDTFLEIPEPPGQVPVPERVPERVPAQPQAQPQAQTQTPATAPVPAKKISKLQAIATKMREAGHVAVFLHEFIKLLPYHDYEICNGDQVLGGCWKKSLRNRYTDIIRIFSEDDIKKMFTHFGFYQMGNVWVKGVNHSLPYIIKF